MPKNMLILQANGKQVTSLDDNALLMATIFPGGLPDDAVISWGALKALIADAFTPIGWLPFAYPQFGSPMDTPTTALALTANGGSYACPVTLESSMLLESVTVRNTDATLARTWNWALYADAGANTLAQVAAGLEAETFTAAAASNRTIAAADAPVSLMPGTYWLVIQCQHASNTFGLGTQAAGTLALNTAQTKTITNPMGATLDFVAATWTKVNSVAGARLNGRVFGLTTAF